MPKARLLVCCGLAAMAVPTAGQAQAPCSAIRFPAGATGTTITGTAPPEEMLCYTLATGNGQTARLRVRSGRNVIFVVEDVADAQDDLTFRTQRRTYRVSVGQLMRSVTPERFAIEISVR